MYIYIHQQSKNLLCIQKIYNNFNVLWILLLLDNSMNLRNYAYFAIILRRLFSVDLAMV